MLAWQYKTLLAELQQVQLHSESSDCPCNLKDLEPPEFCLAKHCLNVHSLASETAGMDKPNERILWELAESAIEQHESVKNFICHKSELPDLVPWARSWRKKIEPIYYACGLKAKMKHQSIPCPLAQEAKVKITGTCSKTDCSVKVKAVESVEKSTTIGGIAEAVDAVIKEIESKKGPKPTPMTFAIGPASLTRYDFKFKVIESSKIIASHDPFTFEPNPQYPQELQPRLRGRAANRAQVMGMAAHLDPDALITDFHSIDRGAPIIGPDGAVESGNGRVMAILHAIKEYPGSYGVYRDAVIEHVERFGISRKQIGKMAEPVLVRERLTDVDRRKFVEEANAATTLTPSSIEVARSDAAKITPEMLAYLVVGEDQGIEDALRSSANAPFVNQLLAKLPPNERSQMADAMGKINQDGIRRITMGVFVNAFPGDAGLRLAEKFFENTDLNIRNVFNGIAASLGKLARSESLAREGQRDPDLAIGDDLSRAVVAFATIKGTPGLTVQKYLSQGQMFERQLTQFQERVLSVLDDHSRSGKKIGAILRAYADLVKESPQPAQSTLIPMPRASKAELFEQAIRKGLEANESVRMFQQPERTTLTELIEGFKQYDIQTVGQISPNTAREIEAMGFSTHESDVTLTRDCFQYILQKHGNQLSDEEWGYIKKTIESPTEVLPNISTTSAPHRSKSILLVRGNGEHYITIIEVTLGKNDNILWNFWKVSRSHAHSYLRKFREEKKARLSQPGGTTSSPHVPRNMALAKAGKPEGLSGSQAGQPGQSPSAISLRRNRITPQKQEVKHFCAAQPRKEFCHVKKRLPGCHATRAIAAAPHE
jgi:hypothetical protein